MNRLSEKLTRYDAYYQLRAYRDHLGSVGLCPRITFLVEDVRRRDRLVDDVGGVALESLCVLQESGRFSRPGEESGDPETWAVDGALGLYYADKVKEIAGGDFLKQRGIRSWMEHTLILPRNIRGQVLWGADRTEALTNDDIQALLRGHLLREESRGGRRWLELAHDRLVDPIRKSNKTWRASGELEPWQQRVDARPDDDWPEGDLLQGQDLDMAQRWADDPANAGHVSARDRLFLQRCQALERTRREQRGRRRNRKLFIGAVIVAVVTLLWGGVNFWQFSVASEARKTAFTRELSMASFALADSELDLSLLLGVAATGIRDLPETKESLLAALSGNPHLQVFLRGHESGVSAVSCRGDFLASADQGGALILWDLSSSPPVQRWRKQNPGRITSLAMSPDATVVAVGSADGILSLWDADDGEFLEEWPSLHVGPVEALAFDPSASESILLASGGCRVRRDGTCEQGGIRIWTLESYQSAPGPGVSLEGYHPGAVQALAYSPDGSLLASGGSKGILVLWDVTPITVTRRSGFLLGHERAVTSVVFSHGGDRLASAGWQGRVLLRSVSKPDSYDVLTEPADPVTSLALAPDRNLLAWGTRVALCTSGTSRSPGPSISL